MRALLLPLLIMAFIWPAVMASAYTDDTFYPIDEIGPGQKGVMLCGLGDGGEVESFEIVVKSVIGNRGRNEDGWRAVLIEAGEELIASHGGFSAGMSGAPIYIDGKLAGAFYRHYEWTLQNFGLMRPIDQMMNLMNQGVDYFVPERSIPLPNGERISDGENDFTSIQEVNGDESEEYLASLVAQGIMPMRPSTAEVIFDSETGAAEGLPMPDLELFRPVATYLDETRADYHDIGPDEFGPGNTITIVRTIGDINIWDIGCITYIDPANGTFVALGHDAFGSIGEMNVPIGDCYVYHNFVSVEENFVLGIPTRIIGTLKRDAWQGITGSLASIPDMVDVNLTMSDSDYLVDRESSFMAASDPEIYIEAIPDAITRALIRSFDSAGQGYVAVNYIMKLDDGTEFEFNQNYLSGNYAASATSDLRPILRAVAKNDFKPAAPVSLDGEFHMMKGDWRLIARELSFARDGNVVEFPEKIPLGETLEFVVRMQPMNAGSYDINFKLLPPEDFPPGKAQVQVFGGLKQIPKEGELPDKIIQEMKDANSDLVDPHVVTTPTSLVELLETFRPEYLSNEIVIQVVSLADEDSEDDKPYFEMTMTIEGAVQGVIVKEIEFEGGDE